MTTTVTLFNHKGGVGKTTLTVNLAGGLADLGMKVLVVDADPQCNISSFFMTEPELDDLLGESKESGESGATIWSAVKPVVDGTGDVVRVPVRSVADNSLFLVPGDVLLSKYEEELPSAWTDSFARKSRGYAVMSAIHRAASLLAEQHQVDIVLYDVGPSVGPLNRAILLGCEHFITPVAPDLFSLRALTSVGEAVARWISDWKTVKMLAPQDAHGKLLRGHPTYLGYVVSAFKAYDGAKSRPHDYWEGKIAPRVKQKVVEALRTVDASLVLPPPYKMGDVKHYQSLAARAQDVGLPIGWMRGHAGPSYNPKITAARELFKELATSMLERMESAKNV